MAVQTVNTYAFNVKRLSGMVGTSQAVGTVGSTPGNYEGEQVLVVATSLANAQATLGVWYGTDLGPVSGGAAVAPGALTQLA